MPNWVQNIIIPDNEFAYNKYAIMKKINKFGERTTELDFSIAAPEPKELLLTQGNIKIYDYIDKKITEFHTKVALKCNTLKDFFNVMQKDKLIIKKYGKRPIVLPKNMNSEDIKDPDQRNLIDYIASMWCFTHYGYCSWYTWRLGNWGCKWNASEYNSDEDGKFFETPWNAPYPWIKTMSKYTDIICLYADEDLGSNCGVIIGSKGNANDFRSADSESSYAYACKIWGEEEPEWDDKPINPQDVDALVESYLDEIGLTGNIKAKVLNALGL